MSRLFFFTIFVFGALLVCIMLPSCFFMPENESDISQELESACGNNEGSGNDLSEICDRPDDVSAPLQQESDKFNKTIYIKLCDVSDVPDYESIYKFMPDGSVKYSVNMYEGFFQDDAKYFIKKCGNGSMCEVYGYQSGKRDEAMLIFTICDDNSILSPTEAPASFINSEEFDKIFKFHADWNSGMNG